MSEFKYEMDTKSRINTARREGREEGEKKGRKEGQKEGRLEREKEVARAALVEGASLDFIHKITGLDITEIKNLAGDK